MREVFDSLKKCWACGFMFHIQGHLKCPRCGTVLLKENNNDRDRGSIITDNILSLYLEDGKIYRD